MDQIILYSINCPKCNILESKLNAKNIKYTKVTNATRELLNLGYRSAPILKVDSKYLQFSEANQWVNSQNERIDS